MGNISQGGSRHVILNGTNLVPGATTVSITGSGVIATSINVLNPSTADIFIVASADPGTRAIALSTTSGTSNPLTLTITSSPVTAATNELFTDLFAGSNDSVTGSTDDSGTAARFNHPVGIWGDGQYLYVTDRDNQTIRRVTINGATVTTLSGSGAIFNNPSGIWGDGQNLFVAETGNHAIRKINLASGAVSTFATGFDIPTGLWGDRNFLYVSDAGTKVIQKINLSTNQISLVAGVLNQSGFNDGALGIGKFELPKGIWGNGDDLYVADQDDYGIRHVSISTGAITTLIEDSDTIYEPQYLWGDGKYLYVTDADYEIVSKVELATGTESIAIDGRLNTPAGIWGDGSQLYVVDTSMSAIVRGLTYNPNPPAQIVDAGTNGPGVVGSIQTLTFRVNDQFGNALAGVTVDFAKTAGNGSIAPLSAVTGVDGRASATIYLGYLAGTNTFTGTVHGTNVTGSASVTGYCRRPNDAAG